MNFSQLAEIENQRLHERLSAIESKIDDIRRLVGPFAVPMPDGHMLVQTLHGIKYLIDPRDLIMAPQLIVYRQWEPDLTSYFCSQLHSNTVFVDVGANFGYFTCLAGAKIGNSGAGKVIAIEPNPALFKLLKANSTINWSMCDISLHACALGAQSGQVDLWIPEDRAANASLSNAPGMNSVKVMLKTLDSLVGDVPNVDILKIDVEGHEAAVLLGAEQMIARSRDIRVVMEWSQSQMKEAGTTIDDMLAIFKKLKIQAFDLPTTSAQIENPELLSEEYLHRTQYTNILLQH